MHQHHHYHCHQSDASNGEETISIESDVISLVNGEETAEGKEILPPAVGFTSRLPICSALRRSQMTCAEEKSDFEPVTKGSSRHRIQVINIIRC